MEAQLLYYDPNQKIVRVPLPKTAVTLGSSERDLIVVEDASVEPQHVRMIWSAQRATWELTRLVIGGTVQIEGAEVAPHEPHPLSQHALIQLGPVTMRFAREPAVPRCGGAEAVTIPLGTDPVVMGRESAAAPAEPGTVRIDLDSDDSGISRVHVYLSLEEERWHIEDRSTRGTDLNGQAFKKEPLTLGDRIRIRDYSFEFTGTALVRVDFLAGGRVEAMGASVEVDDGERIILSDISTTIQSGEFLGVLGGSGHGKSTFLRALCGIYTLSSGRISVDGEPVNLAAAGGRLGYVPQDDIVHTELTVEEALSFSARLRIGASPLEISSLVGTIIRRMGLCEQSQQPVHTLSGGQRKRVNIATELLTRPPVLLLDEPSSGLDPVHEEELMSLLKGLTITGQTVIASTHVLHKAYLFDRLCFLHGGHLMFAGTTTEARKFFFSDEYTGGHSQRTPLERIYFLFSQSAAKTEVWRRKFAESVLARDAVTEGVPPPPSLTHVGTPGAPRPGRFPRLRVLIARQWAILRTDPLNLIFLAAQAVVIGLLAGWAGRAQPEFRMFLAMIATLWFGVSNAAQQFTREIPIFRRERVNGLGLNTYLLSKWIFLTVITIAQCVVLLLCMFAVVGASRMNSNPVAYFANNSVTGDLMHFISFVLTSLVGVGIGLSISAMARSNTQAAIWVPLLLIPQILFAGFVIPLPDMPASVRAFSFIVPSNSSQRLLDAGHVFGKEIPVMTHNTTIPMFWRPPEDSKVAKPWESPLRVQVESKNSSDSPAGKKDRHMNEISPLNRAWQNLTVNYSKLGAVAPDEPNPKDIFVDWRPDVTLDAGGKQTFTGLNDAVVATILLMVWTGLCYFISREGLRRRDPLRWHASQKLQRTAEQGKAG